MTPAALVFDLGGVLIDIDFGRAFAAWGAAAGAPAATIAARFSVDDACCAHERGEMDDAAYFAHLRSTLGIALTDEAMLAGWNAIIGAPLPGSEPLARELAAKRPLYIFSNTNPAHIAHFTPRLGSLLQHFRQLFTSCELGRRKPEPEAFARLAARIGVPASQLVFFDDVEQNVIGARNAGLQAYRVESAAEIRAISANLLAASTAR
jgi:glucose-1-phosphatase